MSVQLYIDAFSQPCRAVWAFCIAANIPFEIKKVLIASGDNKTPEFTKLNPHQFVPAILHNGFALYESHAILAYLCREFPCEDHWYPEDARTRARVNAYLHWHHNNVRFGLAGEVFWKHIRPRLTGEAVSAQLLNEIAQIQKKTLDYLEQVFGRALYVVGTEKPTIADISLYCEVTQLKLIGKNVDAYPNITAWMRRVECIPGILQAHKLINQNEGMFKL